ncbi:MAG: hypothetical protein K1X66_05500 [Verrucomicrobiae bacterium]|nr:hypothetical protein [Verrucomicrobiae bacterium]
MNDKISQRGAGRTFIIGLLLLILVGISIAFWFLKPKGEMTLVCDLATPSFAIDGTVYLVRPLVSEIQLIQERYEKEKNGVKDNAKKSDELLEKEADLIQGRLQALEKKVSQLKEQRDTLREQIQEILNKRRKKVNQIWDEANDSQENDYDSKLKNFKSSIAKRAKELKIDWPEKFDVEAPDVYVSAFRLGLYRASRGSVDKTRELAWAESKLKEWRDFVSELDSKNLEVKGKAFDAQFEAETAVADLQQRLGKLNEEIAKEEASLADTEKPIKEEEKSITPEANVASLEVKYRKELKALPEKFRVATGNRNQDKVYFDHLEKEARPGDYQIWARAKKEDKLYWALVPVTLKSAQRSEVKLEDKHFRELDSILNDTP